MRLVFLTLFSLLLINCKSSKTNRHDRLDVLFIGNSLTYYYDMPIILQSMLEETHPNIRVEQKTSPGMSLSSHLNDIFMFQGENNASVRKKEDFEISLTEKKITEKKWDVIILQTGTVAVLIPENRELVTNLAIKRVKQLISDENCEIVLFETWPSLNKYPKKYCYSSYRIDENIQKEKCCSSTFKNLEDEYNSIGESYKWLSAENNIIKSENGSKFYEVLMTYPELNLYEDSIHPNENGAFLNACIFYNLLTGKKATKLKYVGDLNVETARLLKKISL